ncbi:MAG TPA: alpha/beta family hydrolase [Bryobacteraceae bacterium]|nr:alpha/beta family hydrolase [Bryobacteraceae bacterium]
MARRIESLFIAGPAGRLEALLEEPDDAAPSEACLVCHPHPLFGGTMHNKVVYRLARGLRRSGSVVLRFNFRGVNLSEGAHDEGNGEVEDARAALDALRGRYPDLPYALAGFSFGSRVILKLGCALAAPQPRRLIAVGFPTRLGTWDYLAHCAIDKYFLHSTLDEFGPKQAIGAAFETFSEPKRLEFIDAGDHFFAGALDKLEDAVASLPRTV